MSLETAVAVALWIVVAGFAGAAVFLLGNGIARALYLRRAQPRITTARMALTRLLIDPDAASAAREPLRELSSRDRTRLLMQVGASVTGEARMRLAATADRTGALDHARRLLHSRFWWRRLHAVRVLQRLDAGGRPWLPLLRDPHPAVRAQAAEWAADAPGPEASEALMPLLYDPDALSRFTAQDALLRLGVHPVEPIARLLESGDDTALVPALEVAVALAQPRFAPPAVELCASPRGEVRRLAAMLLGAVGGGEGVAALTRLLTDPELRVRVAAARALGRIGHWPAAAAIARLLRDPEWEVRQAAGFALRALGEPGELLLRRYRQDQDRFAADMARQILELPRGVEAPA